MDVTHANDTVSIPEEIDMDDLLPEEEELDLFYRYSGSLTTPTCDVVVTWTVFSKPNTMSRAQLQQFRTLTNDEGRQLVNNDRPLQPKRSRVVQFSQGNRNTAPAAPTSTNQVNEPVQGASKPLTYLLPMALRPSTAQHQKPASNNKPPTAYPVQTKPPLNYPKPPMRPPGRGPSSYPSPYATATSRPYSSSAPSAKFEGPYPVPLAFRGLSSHQIQRPGLNVNQWTPIYGVPSRNNQPQSYSASYYSNNPTPMDRLYQQLENYRKIIENFRCSCAHKSAMLNE